MRPLLGLAALLLATLPGRAWAQQAKPLIDRCRAETCVARLTPDQLLGEAEKLVAAGRYDEAKPMLAALSQVRELRFQTRFLSGYVAAHKGDHAGAAATYKQILAEDPGQTRVRLELGREMLALGQTASADRQFRIAQHDRDLPDDVARTIRGVRDIIRAQRAWRLDLDFGFAPDSNINNATSADTVNILWGGGSLPLTLDERAKARSGTGQTASLSAGLRLPIAERVSLLADVDTNGTNYSGTAYDDYQVQLAAGPELRLSRGTSISVEALGAQRWYGGHVITRQAGAKLGFQTRLTDADQIGLQLDTRRTNALFDHDYDGWQIGAYATYERAVSKTLVASAGLFARRDSLVASAYSSTEIGGILGFGGELRHGITFGVSATVSRAHFDAPMVLFSLDPRRDWRLGGRVTLGYRKIRLLGFSPEVSATYARTDSSLALYGNDRLRFRFALARYF